MEQPSPTGPENNPGPEKKKWRDKLRSSVEVLRDWIYYRDFGETRHSSKETTEDDSDSPEKAEAKKRRKRFSDLFNISAWVEKRSVKTKEDAQKEKASELPLLPTLVSVDKSKAAESEESAVAQIETDEAPQEEDEEPSELVAAAVGAETTADEAKLEDDDLKEIDLSTADEADAMHTVPLAPEQEEAEEKVLVGVGAGAQEATTSKPTAEEAARLLANTHALPSTPLAMARYEEQMAADAVANTTKTPEAHTIVEHNSGGALLAGAEYLARKRDTKKLRKEQAKTNQAVQKLQKSQAAAEAAKPSAALTETAGAVPIPAPERQTKEVPAAPSRAPSPEKAPVVNPSKGADKLTLPAAGPESAVKLPEKQQSLPSSMPESIKQILEKRAEDRKQAEKLALSNYENVQPETVRQAVEKMAEKNVAIEGLYEKRHEAKDDDNKFTASQDQSTGMAGKLAAGRGALSSLLGHDQATTDADAQKLAEETAQMYRRAVLNGVWAAVIFVVLLAVVAVIR